MSPLKQNTFPAKRNRHESLRFFGWCTFQFWHIPSIFSIQRGNLLKQISNLCHFLTFLTILTFLIPHTIIYCFSTRCTYLTPVPSGEQVIAVFMHWELFCMPECYTHAPTISGICHLNGDSN